MIGLLSRSRQSQKAYSLCQLSSFESQAFIKLLHIVRSLIVI